ncbi:uncharacterized protein LOC132564208, partial [Ylistrum balloti]|uniref:uncharacterized protein LOC132564208 n=1 Tax=Ylistrum balloti TaxID=509963 RepID=UPI002905F732
MEYKRTGLVFTDLCVNHPKEILKHVSGVATMGNILAVMGPSGSGKTTLLNALAGSVHVTSGKITLDGSSFGKQQRRRLGYVLQDEVFLSNLTLWETLYFTAILSMPETTSQEQKLQQIDSIVKSLGLEKCLHTVVGDIFNSGLSGGERKRTSIACELLRDPDLLLIDEPTSGLDSSIAHDLMVQLRDYATNYNKTLVTTIHQPSSQAFHMFSNLLLLLEGQVVYFGPADSALNYLTSLGISFLDEYNPADILLDVITSDCDTVCTINEGAIQKRYNNTVPDGKTLYSYHTNGVEPRGNEETSGCTVLDIVDDGETHRWPSSFWTQFAILNWRSFKQVKGNLSVLDVLVPGVLAVTASLIFFQIGNEETTARDKFGLVFFTFVFLGYSTCLTTVRHFDTERGVVRKERSAGVYRLSAYYLSKMTSELPLVLISPVLMITMIYWVVGLGEVDGYFVFLSIGILYTLMMQSVALVIGFCSSDLRFNTVVVFMCLNVSLNLGGVYTVNPPEWLVWGKYLAFFHYPSAATMTYLLVDIDPM